MEPPAERLHAGVPGPTQTPPLPLLVPIAVAVAAGCEPCAVSVVRRALALGAPRRLVGDTLRIVAAVRARACFVREVGPDVAGRMDAPLRAATQALRAGEAGERGNAGVGCGV